MNQALKILEWCKANVILIVCGVVMLLSLVSFIWPSMSKSSAFRKEMNERQSEVSTIQGLESQSLAVPGEQADAPPQNIKAVLNDATIAKRKEINESILKDTAAVGQYAVEVNRRGLEPMIPGLFPNASAATLLTESKLAYKGRIEELYHFLNPTAPLSAQEQTDLLAEVQEQYHGELPPTDQGRLKPDQEAELARRQAARIQLAIQERALAHHVYAEPAGLVQPATARPTTATQGSPTDTPAVWQPGPFQIESWAFDTTLTPHEVVWESQMQLWIQQVMASSIARANEIYLPDGSAVNTESSIINQPVKQLVYMEVFPPDAKPTAPSRGGSAAGDPSRRQPSFSAPPRQPSGGFQGFPGGPGGTAAPGAPGAAAEPTDAGLSYQEYKDAMLKRIEDDFASPTGRRTNLLYDVRYAEMQVLVDSKLIPKLFNAVNQTNLMTIINVSMEDVDEYASFAEGYFFGPAVDVVRLTLRVETLWLRAWTMGHFNEEHFKEEQEKGGNVAFNPGLMPDIVRWKLKLPTRDKGFRPPAGATREDTSGSRTGN